jgi:hypothetical protein
MHNSFSTLSLAIAVAVSAATASAANLVWTDVDLEGPAYRYLTANPSWYQTSYYESSFNILNDGFNPATMDVSSAYVKFAFADDSSSDSGEWVDIKLGGNLRFDDVEVDGTWWNQAYDWVSGGLSGSFLADLQDGILTYKVKVVSGDTYLKEAKLIAKGDYSRVPDGGSTVALLGAGLLGLLALKRRR